MKPIKADPPSLKSRSLIGWSDMIMAKYLNLLITDKNIIVEGEVNNKALEYAKSIHEYGDYLRKICEGKTEKERKKIVSLYDNVWKGNIFNQA